MPDYLGGSVNINHKEWLVECNKLVTNRASTCNNYYYCSSSSLSSSSLTSSTTTTAQILNGDISSKLNKNNNEISNKIIQTDSEKTSNRKRQSTDLTDLEDKKPIKKQISNTSPFIENSEYLLEKIDPLPFKN